MNDSGLSVLRSDHDLLEGPSVAYRPSGPDLISDEAIDYHAIAISTQPDQPGGRIVFSTADFATEEEAMAAMGSLFMSDMEDDDELSATA